MKTVFTVFAVLLATFAGLSPTRVFAAINPSAAPWQITLARDGNFYGASVGGGVHQGGCIYRITPTGAVRTVGSFSHINFGGMPSRNGSGPEGELGAGADGALYGCTRDGGVFGGGVLFKYDPATRKVSLLHHFIGGGGYKHAVLAARGGTILAIVNNGDRIFRLFPDGTHDYLNTPSSYAIDMVETADGVILLTTHNGAIWRLNSQSSFERVANVDTYPRSLRALDDGAVVGLTSTTVFHLAANNAVTTLHAFGAAFEGTGPESLFLAPDGSYLGTTWEGGLQGTGVVFKLVPGSNTYSVLHHLGPYGGDRAAMWLKEAFPLVLPPGDANLPPTARADVIPARLVKIPAGSPAGTPPQVRIHALKNDKDADRDALSIAGTGSASHGAVTLDPATQTILYSAHSVVIENDEFSYTISDGHGGTATARVHIRTSPAGKYAGSLATPPNPASGDPGTSIGTFSLKVGANGSASVKVGFIDRTYSFSAKFNEANQFSHILQFQPRTGELRAAQFVLRPQGSGWFVEVTATGYNFRASGVGLPAP